MTQLERQEPKGIEESGAIPDGAPVTVIRPRSGWKIVDLHELGTYRDLYFFLVWRSVKVRYAQSVLGIGWAVIQPLFQMVVFTVVFGRLAGVKSDGVPYPVFSFAALLPWTYFSSSLTEATDSLVANASILSKVYFPRLILPMAAVLAKLVDFAIASLVLAGLMVWYGTAPNLGMLVVPGLVLVMMATAAGAGMWLTALAIQYRDVKYAMSFLVQLLMYAAPVVYPASLVPERYRLVYALNPMVGVIEGFRSGLLGTRGMPWDMIGVGAATGFVLLITGALYFTRKERLFADVA
jgi:lipopolysaccharide transport system permease protein